MWRFQRAITTCVVVAVAGCALFGGWNLHTRQVQQLLQNGTILDTIQCPLTATVVAGADGARNDQHNSTADEHPHDKPKRSPPARGWTYLDPPPEFKNKRVYTVPKFSLEEVHPVWDVEAAIVCQWLMRACQQVLLPMSNVVSSMWLPRYQVYGALQDQIARSMQMVTNRMYSSYGDLQAAIHHIRINSKRGATYLLQWLPTPSQRHMEGVNVSPPNTPWLIHVTIPADGIPSSGVPDSNALVPSGEPSAQAMPDTGSGTHAVGVVPHQDATPLSNGNSQYKRCSGGGGGGDDADGHAEDDNDRGTGGDSGGGGLGHEESTSGGPGGSSGGGVGGSGGGNGDGSSSPGGNQQHLAFDPELLLQHLRTLSLEDLMSILGLLPVDVSALLSLPQRSAGWHAARNARITASDAAALLGHSHHTSAQQALQNKLSDDVGRSQQVSAEVAARMASGVQLEATAADAFLHALRADPQWAAFECVFEQVGLVVQPARPWLGASPDRIIVCVDPLNPQAGEQRYVLEVKVCVDSDPPASLPMSTRIQVLTQLYCTGFAGGFVWYFKEGRTPLVHHIVWDVAVEREWHTYVHQLQYTFQHDLAPQLVVQRLSTGTLQADTHAKLSEIVADVTLRTAESSGTTQRTPLHVAGHADKAFERLAAAIAELQSGSDSDMMLQPGASVVYDTQPSWGVGIVLDVQGSAQEGYKYSVKFPKKPRSVGKAARNKPFSDKNLVRVHVGTGGDVVQPTQGMLGQVVQAVGRSNLGRIGVTVEFTSGGSWHVLFQGDSSPVVLAPGHVHVLTWLDPSGMAAPNAGWASGDAAVSFPDRSLYADHVVDLDALHAWLDEYQHDATTPIEFVVVDNKQHVAVLGDITNTQAVSSVSVDDTTLETVQAHLQPEKKWTLRLGCRRGHASHGHKVSKMKFAGCKFCMTIRHDAHSRQVLITETTWHTGHDVRDPSDGAFLHPTSEAVCTVRTLLEAGICPKKVTDFMNRHADAQLAGASAEEYINSFSNNRMRWTVGMVKAQQVRLTRELLPTFLPDAQQVEQLVSGRYKDWVVHFQPHKAKSTDSQEVPFILALAHPWQRAMLNQFGRQLVHLDATGGTNKNGFMVHVLLVVDEYGNGVPVGYLLASSESATVLATFLQAMRDQVRATAPSAGDFNYGHFMIDKCPTEMAAIRATMGEDRHLLCWFHLLQEWERFAKSAEGGLKDPMDRALLLTDLHKLKQSGTELLFKSELHRFYNYWRGRAATGIVHNMERNWAGCAASWADFGRPDIPRDTNNHAERSFGILKYDLLDRKTKNSIPQLLVVLCEKVTSRYMWDRAEKLGRHVVSRREIADTKQADAVAEIVSSNAICVLQHELGLCMVGGSEPGQSYMVCLGGLSCSCPHGTRHLSACKHLRAVQDSPVYPKYTHGLRTANAHFVILTPLDGEGNSGIYSCSHMHYQESSAVTLSVHENYCSCLGFKLHGACCHLIAASCLPGVGESVSTIAWESMDDNEPLAIAPPVVLAHPDVEPLSVEMMDALTRMHVPVTPTPPPASVQRHDEVADSASARARHLIAKCQARVTTLSDDAAQPILGDLEDLLAKLDVHCEAQSLPVTAKKLDKVVADRMLRQEHFRRMRPLMRRYGTTHAKKQLREMLEGQRASAGVAGIVRRVLQQVDEDFAAQHDVDVAGETSRAVAARVDAVVATTEGDHQHDAEGSQATGTVAAEAQQPLGSSTAQAEASSATADGVAQALPHVRPSGRPKSEAMAGILGGGNYRDHVGRRLPRKKVKEAAARVSAEHNARANQPITASQGSKSGKRKARD